MRGVGTAMGVLVSSLTTLHIQLQLMRGNPPHLHLAFLLCDAGEVPCRINTGERKARAVACKLGQHVTTGLLRFPLGSLLDPPLHGQVGREGAGMLRKLLNTALCFR